MKKVIISFSALVFVPIILNSCSGGSKNEAVNEGENVSIDICRCLTEPGNSDWTTQNKDACREAISKEMDVENYENVNFSKEPELSRKWDQLVEKCTGSSEVKTGVDIIDENSNLIKHIGRQYGYIWESINIQAQIYTTLVFDGLVFGITSYSMNGASDSEDFTKLIDLSGSWHAIDEKNAEGIFEQNNVIVSWQFADDYSTLTNNKGIVFSRIKVK